MLYHPTAPSSIGTTVTSTIASVIYYADADNGDDDNDGLTLATAKATPQAALDLVPQVVKHHTMVLLLGAFTTTTATKISRYIDLGINLMISGEIDYTIVDDNSGSKYTASGSSTSTLVMAGAGWTADEHMGYWVRVLTGPAAGAIGHVKKNTTDTVTVCYTFSVDPGVGATFEFIRPKTTITSAVGGAALRFNSVGGGYAFLQMLSLDGKVNFQTGRGNGNSVWVSGVMVIGNPYTAFQPYYAKQFGLINTIYQTDVLPLTAVTTLKLGCSVLSSVTSLSISAKTLSGLTLIQFVAKKGIRLVGCGITALLKSGSRCLGMVELRSCRPGAPVDMMEPVAGFSAPEISNTAGVGLFLVDCDVIQIQGGDVSDCGSHGVEAVRSHVYFTGAFTGSGNTGAGVYAHSNSVVRITDGTPPTLTGTVGDLTTDGTTQASTWSAIDGGTPVADLGEMTMAKEV